MRRHLPIYLERARAVKRLAFTGDETSSPVSNMFIKEATSVPLTVKRAEITKIPNVIGDYVCSLYKVHKISFYDALHATIHRVSGEIRRHVQVGAAFPAEQCMHGGQFETATARHIGR